MLVAVSERQKSATDSAGGAANKHDDFLAPSMVNYFSNDRTRIVAQNEYSCI